MNRLRCNCRCTALVLGVHARLTRHCRAGKGANKVSQHGTTSGAPLPTRHTTAAACPPIDAPQVGFTRLAPLYLGELGQARVRMAKSLHRRSVILRIRQAILPTLLRALVAIRADGAAAGAVDKRVEAAGARLAGDAAVERGWLGAATRRRLRGTS